MRHKILLGIVPVAAIVASSLLASASTAPAQVQNQCAARNEMIQQLDAQFSEKPAAIGQVDEQSVVEIFVSDQGTWTILVTGTDGGTCVLASGEGWDTRGPALAASLRGA
jgi:hypothetical protein